MFFKPEIRLKFSVIILGFTAIITQIILLREFFNIFYGNELITGIILANWMILTGLGALLGKSISKNYVNFKIISLAHIVIGILPGITALLIYFSRQLLFHNGVLINLFETFFISLFLLAPFCIVAGILFTLFSHNLSTLVKANIISKVYAYEAMGSIIGGLLFNVIFIFIFNSFFSLILLLMINCLTAVLHYYASGKKFIASTILTATVVVTFLFIFSDVEKKSLQLLFPGQNLVFHKDTPYGKIVVTKTGNQYNFYENGIFLYSDNNIIENEESIHFAMSQHPHPETVLLICGGASGVMHEIFKYKVGSLDYIDPNLELIKAAENYTGNIIRGENIRIIHEDARLFLRKNLQKKYDLVIINLPDPTSANINRYFTYDFFEELQMHLNEYAIVSISLSSVSSYMSEQSVKINSSLYSTLKLFFQNVRVVPGGKNYFIASNGNLSTNITRLIEDKKIRNEYVNYYYLEDSLIARESKRVENMISENVMINSDFKPVTYYFQLQYWLSYFKLNYWILLVVFLAVATLIVFRLNYVNFGLFITGFTASSLELILIVAFQVIYGFTYQMMGILITFFMVGLMFGSLMANRKSLFTKKTYSLIQYTIGIFSLIIALSLTFLRSSINILFLVPLIFVLLVSSVGVLTGLQFSIASKLRTEPTNHIAASSYATDLFGSAIGSILIASFIIPFYGILKATLFIAIINFITGLFLLTKSR